MHAEADAAELFVERIGGVNDVKMKILATRGAECGRGRSKDLAVGSFGFRHRCIEERHDGCQQATVFQLFKACEPAPHSRTELPSSRLADKAKSFFTIRGNDRGGPRTPPAPPEYRGGGHATVLFIPPLYSGGARGGRPTID